MQERGPYFALSAAELVQKIKAGEPLWLMDIRKREKYQAGHIPGANHLPRENFGDYMQKIPRDKIIIVICESGAAAGQVAGMLGSMGYQAGVLLGGMKSWKKTFASF